ncbi:MAG: TetR/AcrR family transcriptional regulator, partial [Gammaproteobacteria bacterium]|nr:TetR/AcrR family transcriptional regulator [Gammaproteobacteria bacterium]MCW8958299.1 TetR/AcrR family transcriptional regulator [Gammaproteobacteria bacterium]
MGKSHEVRKQEIIEATMALSVEKGLKKLTTQAIADRVGIAQPTIFRHFKSRDAIFGAVINWVGDSLFKVIGDLFSTPGPADERLHQIILKQLAFMGKHRAIPRVLFSDRLHLESPKLKTVVQTMMDGYAQRLTRLIEEGIEQRVFSPELEPDRTARFILAAIQGLVMRWSVYEFNFSL